MFVEKEFPTEVKLTPTVPEIAKHACFCCPKWNKHSYSITLQDFNANLWKHKIYVEIYKILPASMYCHFHCRLMSATKYNQLDLA